MTELDPSRCLTAEPGGDGVLISRREIRAWLARVEAATDRLRIHEIGTSTEGRPIDAIVISDNLAGNRLDDLRDQRQHAIETLTHRNAPVDWHKPIVLITSGIHATEVGGPQSIPGLIHWLVFDESSEVRAMRERLLTIIVPTLNPDGMDMVQRWHDATAGTRRAGSPPPLLYHRHAGHDNNRDWIYRNLPETRAVLDAIHRQWLPHVTLDQHQMNPEGPRFVLPPYADPWEPHIHPQIVAAANGLGQAIATDLTLSGRPGVTTGRYFDAWEPSRAIQHYRGGVRILAEAASANLAHPITISPETLATPPLPQEPTPTTAMPLPWPGGTWRLRDIVDYHLATAKSLLVHISRDPERWLDLQPRVLRDILAPELTVQIPTRRHVLDRGASQRLAGILTDADLTDTKSTSDQASVQIASPLGRLSAALIFPKPFPEARGSSSYDLTTHHLPAMLGAVVTSGHQAHTEAPALGDGNWLALDAHSHRAPELVEAAGPGNVFRTTRRSMVEATLIDPGTWLVARDAVPEALHALARTALDQPPEPAIPVRRRDLVLLSTGDQPTADHGWTRWWLEARRIPYLEADEALLPDLMSATKTTTMLLADTAQAGLSEHTRELIIRFVEAGGHVIAFGHSGRTLASAIPAGIDALEFPAGGPVHAPGALLRLLPAREHPIAMGLDRAIPAMFQRDGVFVVSRSTRGTRVLGRFAGRDTVMSGWMSDPGAVSDAPAIIEARHGAGHLHAFSFCPLFRGQMLVTAPLVHNLIYTMELPSCPPHDRAKTSARPTSGRTS